MLVFRGVVRVLSQALFLSALFFLPIGGSHWPRAVQFLGAFTLISILGTLSLARWAPASLEARIRKGAVRDQPRADRIASMLIAVSHIGWFLFIPNDVFRWQLLPEPPSWAVIAGGIISLLGYGIMFAAVAQNSFAAPIVGDQSQRNHTLVDWGLYGVVRHPPYLGNSLFLSGLALWLGSLAALLLVPLALSPLVGRIRVEEMTLRESLPGYAEYCDRVRSRIIPGLW
jgi:protein-S-isoprenylcysteine O-methyltransferase Ste14